MVANRKAHERGQQKPHARIIDKTQRRRVACDQIVGNARPIRSLVFRPNDHTHGIWTPIIDCDGLKQPNAISEFHIREGLLDAGDHVGRVVAHGAYFYGEETTRRFATSCYVGASFHWMPNLAVLLAVAAIASPQAKQFPDPPAQTLVLDEAGLLSASDSRQVSEICRSVRTKLGAPLAVVTVRSLAEYGARPDQLEQFTKELFNDWRVGSKANNRGAILFVAKAERKIRIELGSAWRRDLDAPAKQILQTQVAPRLKKGDYTGGILAGVTALRDLLTRRS